MVYKLEKDGKDHIALFFVPESDEAWEYMGSFDKNGYWVQYDGNLDWVMDIEDCREVVRISDLIIKDGFDKVYEDAPDCDDYEETL
jgi:hypothetical protein